MFLVESHFYHDGLMRRYAMENSAGVTYFVWDKGGLNLLAEKDSSGNVTAEYIHGYSPVSGIGTLVAAKKMIGETAYYQYPQYDHRGSVVGLTDKAGNVIASYEYDAWGNILQSNETAAVITAGNRFKYQSNWLALNDSDGSFILPPHDYMMLKPDGFCRKIRCTANNFWRIILPLQIRLSPHQKLNRINTTLRSVIMFGLMTLFIRQKQIVIRMP